jgi:hypothetical protein
MEWILAIIFLAFAVGFASAIGGVWFLIWVGPEERVPD